MKVILLQLALMATVLVVTANAQRVQPAVYIRRLTKPTVVYHRVRREAPPKTGLYPLPSGLGYEKSILKGNNGQLSGMGGFQVVPGHGVLTNAGMKATVNKGPGSFSATVNKPLNGPDKRPTYGLGYNHEIYNKKDGSLSIGINAQKLPGQNWQPSLGVQGTFG